MRIEAIAQPAQFRVEGPIDGHPAWRVAYTVLERRNSAFIRLPGSDLWVPRLFTIEVDFLEENLTGLLDVEIDDGGQPRCNRVEVYGGAITFAVIQKLSIAKILRAGVQRMAWQEGPDGQLEQLDDAESNARAESAWRAAERRRVIPPSADNLERVAQLIRSHLAEVRVEGTRRRPYAYVAEQLHISKATAGRRIKEAQIAGLLPADLDDATEETDR